MAVKRALAAATRIVTAFGAVVSVGLLASAAHAHHSYAMYDGSVYRVFTGVVVRVIPNAAHFEMHFVPLNQERNALVRDDKGEPLVWVVQMESAGQAYKDGITKESFPQGTVFSMGLHPLRDGKLAGDRGSRVCSNVRRAPGLNLASIATRSPAPRRSGPASCRKRPPRRSPSFPSIDSAARRTSRPAGRSAGRAALPAARATAARAACRADRAGPESRRREGS